MQAYQYAALPHTLEATKKKPRYRDEFTAGKYANIMYDRRVVRGSTYAPLSGGEGAEEQIGRGDRPDDDEAVARELGTSKTRSSDTSIFDLRPPARQFIPVPVDAHLIEDTHTPLVVEVQTQTDLFLPRPATPPYVPLKTGIDASTQVDDDANLFVFDRESAPLVDVIVSKTLEQALLEVEEEEELEALRKAKAAFVRRRAEEQQRVTDMERAEAKKWEQKEKARRAEHLHLRQERTVRGKVAAVAASRLLMGQMCDRVMQRLDREGFFPDPVREEIERRFLPSLLDGAQRRVALHAAARQLLDELLQSSIQGHNNHVAALVAEAAARRPKKGYIRITVRGVDGRQAMKVIGPMQITREDSVGAVEEKIQTWLVEHSDESDAVAMLPPLHRVRLYSSGQPLDAAIPLLSLSVEESASMEVRFEPPPPIADLSSKQQRRGSGDGASRSDSDAESSDSER